MKHMLKKLTLFSFLSSVAFAQPKVDPFAHPQVDPFAHPQDEKSAQLQADQYVIESKFMTAPSKWLQENQLENTPKEVSTDIFKTAMEKGMVDFLSAPRVTANANQEARIVIQESPLAYMEKVGDGYQPRLMPEGTGAGIEFTVKMSGVENKPGHCLLDFSTTITSVSGREPVPFQLDVGKPIIRSQKYDSTVECFNDRWYFLAKLASLDAGNDEVALIFCKIQKVHDEEKPKSKNFPIKLISDKISFDSDKGILKANGNVQIQEENFVIYSDKLEFIQEPKESKGPAIQADSMTLESPESRIRYSGNVRLRIPGGVIRSEELYIQQLVDSPKIESSLEKKLKQVIIPQLSFKEASLKDTVDFLRSVSGQHSPDGEPVDFVLTPTVNGNIPVSLELRNLPLYHIIRLLTEQCGHTYELDEEAGVVILR